MNDYIKSIIKVVLCFLILLLSGYWIANIYYKIYCFLKELKDKKKNKK